MSMFCHFNQPKMLKLVSNRTPTMARVTPFFLFALLQSKTAYSSIIHAEEPLQQDKIDNAISFVFEQIASNSWYGGSHVHLFRFCKQSDPVFERLMCELINFKPLTILIGDRVFLFPLETVIQKSTFNLIMVESKDSLMVSKYQNFSISTMVFANFSASCAHQTSGTLDAVAFFKLEATGTNLCHPHQNRSFCLQRL
jgi:hypothetical protein